MQHYMILYVYVLRHVCVYVDICSICICTHMLIHILYICHIVSNMHATLEHIYVEIYIHIYLYTFCSIYVTRRHKSSRFQRDPNPRTFTSVLPASSASIVAATDPLTFATTTVLCPVEAGSLSQYLQFFFKENPRWCRISSNNSRKYIFKPGWFSS